jgi:hypothetical protein
MSSGLTPAKRFAIRASLVTGSTVALIVGAQTLITVDVQAGRMSPDGSTLSSDSAAQPADEIASSGVSVIRQSSQQPQVQFDQQNPLPTPQPLRHRPRTHSSH